MGSPGESSKAALEPSDHKEARDFKEQQKAGTTQRASLVQFLQQRGLLTLAEASTDLCEAGANRPAQVGERAAPSKVVWTWTESYLKTIAPPCPGATIQNVVNSYTTSWTARFKGAKPKGSHSIRYGGKTGVDSDMAARGCMVWLWSAYIAANPGQQCPYDFASLAMPEGGESPRPRPRNAASSQQ